MAAGSTQLYASHHGTDEVCCSWHVSGFHLSGNCGRSYFSTLMIQPDPLELGRVPTLLSLCGLNNL